MQKLNIICQNVSKERLNNCIEAMQNLECGVLQIIQQNIFMANKLNFTKID